MEILKLSSGMLAELKKPHPCGNRNFRILRVGSICRVICTGCGRDMDLDRVKLERAIKRILPEDSQIQESENKTLFTS